MKMPYYECPRFQRCNANVCPLDPLSDEKETLKGEEVCKVEKPTRLRIGSKYPDLVVRVGYKKREFQAKQAWDRLTDEQKMSFSQQGIKALKSLKTGIQGSPDKLSKSIEGSLQ